MMQRPGSSGDVVLADIGGTNVRFAMLSRGEVTQVEHMAVADHTQFADALAAFLARQPETKAAHRILFDVAGVVDGEYCRLTNNDWVVDGKELRARFGFTDVHLINDFEAVAWSLLALKAKDLMQHGGGAAQPDAPMLAIGPGTGFGVAAYVPRAGGFVLHGEGGHATMPGGSAREDAIIALLRKEFGHVSVERVLSGQGLENLYGAISAVDGKRVAERKAPEIMQAAAADTCAVSRAAVDMFCAMLGEAAGNLALSFGAAGGVYLAGGIPKHLRKYLPQSQFRARFDAKGRMSPYVAQIPVYLILHDDPAFLGLHALAARRGWSA